MRPLHLACASALTLTAAACGPRIPPARAALDCPATQGDLTRTAVSPDGKACTYAGEGGAEVALQLVDVKGSPVATLAAIEANLLAGRAPAAAAAAAPKAKPAAAVDTAEKAAREAAEDSKGVSVEIDGEDGDGKAGGGKSPVVTEHDGTTRVNLPGIHVVANDQDDSADVQIGPLSVKAGDGVATVRMLREVRLRGEALNPERRGVRAMFIYTGDDLPAGYRFVGYEAGGPKRGPITVAVVKSRSESADRHDLYPDVKKLVRKNGGV